MHSKLLFALLLAATFALSACAGEKEADGAPAKEETTAAPPPAAVTPEAIAAAQLPSYPHMPCPVSGEPLGSMGEPVNWVSHGRLVRFCCAGCEGKFESDPAKYVAKIDTAVVAEQGPRYPLATCPVDGAELGSRGAAVEHVHGTKLVRFCRDACRDEFVKSPATAMARVDEAWIAAQLADYPTDQCPVMGMANDAMGEPIDILHGTRLVRVCCETCVEEFRAEPAKFLAKLDEAS